MEAQFKQNQVLYLIRGLSYAKCIIDEIFIHYKQNETLVKYAVRPFGSKDHITMNEDEFVMTLQEAKEIIEKRLCENFEASMEALKSVTEETFDKAEQEYQESIINKGE
jgi:hypothetical protein